MWSNASSSPVELRPASAGLTAALAVLALAAVVALLTWSGVPLVPAAAALLAGAGGLARAVCRRPALRSLRSPRPGQWCATLDDGTSRAVRLQRAWTLGPWIAAVRLAAPDGGCFTVTMLCCDQVPGAWRRLLVRLRTT
jgi:hypothetical protein